MYTALIVPDVEYWYKLCNFILKTQFIFLKIILTASISFSKKDFMFLRTCSRAQCIVYFLLFNKTNAQLSLNCCFYLLHPYI